MTGEKHEVFARIAGIRIDIWIRGFSNSKQEWKTFILDFRWHVYSIFRRDVYLTKNMEL